MPGITKSTLAEGQSVAQLDPAALLLDANVRLDPRVDKDFIASVKEHGVLVPIVGIQTAAGVRVRMGHRRTLAAIEAKLALVPVIVVGDEQAGDAGEVERLVQQYAENEHRTGLTDAERIGVTAQLAAFGVSAAQIAKKTRMPRTQVDAALTAAGSDLAKAATVKYDLTIDQAATVAEFDDDTETVKALVAAAATGQFEHVAQRARDDRAAEQERQAAAEALAASGVTLLDEEASETAQRLTWLTADPETRELITPEDHAACPGHAADLEYRWVWHDDTDGENGDQECSGYEWVPVWLCINPEANGHHPRSHVNAGGSDREPVRVADMDDEQREAARAARREVIENNKAWESAQTVRREWLKAFLTRKTAPKGTSTFLARALAQDADTISSIGGNHLAAELLGIETPSWGRAAGIIEAVESAGEGRVQVIHLAIALAAYEDATNREQWRTKSAGTARYLQHLLSLGYELSPVEQLASS